MYSNSMFMFGWRLLSSSRAGWSSLFHLPGSTCTLKSPLRVTLVFSTDDDILVVDWFDGISVKELYPASSVFVVLADKLEAVVSAGCKIVGVVMMIIRRLMTTTTGPVLAIQYCPVLHNRNLLLNIIVLTPALVFPTAMHKE